MQRRFTNFLKPLVAILWSCDYNIEPAGVPEA